MKRILVGLCTLGMLLGVAQVASADEAYLGTRNFVNLSTSDSSITVDIGYPGKISQICGVAVSPSFYWVTEQDLQAVSGALRVVQGTPWDLDENGELAPNLPEAAHDVGYTLDPRSLGTYVTWVTVETRSGEPLADLFARLIHNQGLEKGPVAVVLRAVGCK